MSEFKLVSSNGHYLVNSESWVLMDSIPGRPSYILFNVYPEPTEPLEYNILILSDGKLYGARRDEDYLNIVFGKPDRLLLSDIVKIVNLETRQLKEDWMEKYCISSK